jgi:DNA-directed RNA polymerase subunit beta'
MTFLVRNESGMEKEHHVPQDKHVLVHAGDSVEAGDPLIEGPMIPHDILRIKGEEALQNYLLREVQAVYRSQNVGINDKHLEVILCQMLRKVQVSTPGDSSFLPGEVVDKFRFRRENERLTKSVGISNAGDTDLSIGEVVLKSRLADINAEVEDEGGEPAKGKKPKPASATTLLLGITKASLSSDSFISSASFQETTKVLTEAALAGMSDELQGLKENVILGHLIPAGTAYRPYQMFKVKHLGEPIPAPPDLPAEVAPSIENSQEMREAEVAVAAGALMGGPMDGGAAASLADSSPASLPVGPMDVGADGSLADSSPASLPVGPMDGGAGDPITDLPTASPFGGPAIEPEKEQE